MFNHIHVGLGRANLPYVASPVHADGLPRRKQLFRPVDDGTFVLPLKQSFIKDPRCMPGTKIMVAMLTGWAGTQQSIVTSMRVIGEHLNRSTRQVYRYLQEAMEEGYLLYCQVKNRLGYITGIKIWINRPAIRRKTRKFGPVAARPRRNPGMTQKSDINEKKFNSTHEDPEIKAAPDRFWKAMTPSIDYGNAIDVNP